MNPKMIFFFGGLWLLGGPTLLPGLLPLQPALLQLWKHRGHNNSAQCSPVGLTSAPCWPEQVSSTMEKEERDDTQSLSEDPDSTQS